MVTRPGVIVGGRNELYPEGVILAPTLSPSFRVQKKWCMEGSYLEHLHPPLYDRRTRRTLSL